MERPFRFLEIIPNFLLYFLFCGGILSILLSGARVYQEISAGLEEQFSVTTCASYLTAKLHHYDAAGRISVGTLDDTECLLLQEEIAGRAYTTYLYCYEGELKELFCAADAAFSPQDGETIMPMDQLVWVLQDGLLSFRCAAGEDVASAAVHLQCAESGGGR